ncbi:MAG: SAM hydrolase/SAM-dependent halogenase family protein [Bradymonadaceae bacterium]
MTTPFIGLLSDFGHGDAYTGIMKSVIFKISPGANVVDLCHEIAPQDILSGAYVLHSATPYLPRGAIVVAVVDPGVGSSRRSVAVRTEDFTLVGPDNGLFAMALAHNEPLQVVELDNSEFHLPHVSATFHGRDVFAPAAAHLARGASFDELGSPVDPETLKPLSNAHPTEQGKELLASVIHIDRFGNAVTNLILEEFEAWQQGKAEVKLGVQDTELPIVETFSDVPVNSPLAFWGSGGHLELAVRDGNFANDFGIAQGSLVLLSPR